MLGQPHVAPLTAFVRSIRQRRAAIDLDFQPEDVPFFDPLDGGIHARVLFLSEAPGPQAVRSGFISRNNPDSTAENNFRMQSAAGIIRSSTVRWNVVAWYIGDRKRIRPANVLDFGESRPYLRELLGLLKELRIVALLGLKAQAAWDAAEIPCQARVVRTYHLSPLSMNTSIERREHVQASFREIARELN